MRQTMLGLVQLLLLLGGSPAVAEVSRQPDQRMLTFSPPAHQDPVDPRTMKRFSLVLDFGGSVGGPAAGLAAQLRRAGFDHTSPETCFFGLCSGPIPHPSEDGPGANIGFTARFLINETVAIGGGISNASLGGSIGYRTNDDAIFGGDHIMSHWDVTVVWSGAFVNLGYGPPPTPRSSTPRVAVRVGGGPALYRLENVPESFTVTRIGLLGEAGAELPADRRFFLNLAVRGHLIPPTDVAHGRTVSITLRPNWTHVAFLVGFGIHL